MTIYAKVPTILQSQVQLEFQKRILWLSQPKNVCINTLENNVLLVIEDRNFFKFLPYEESIIKGQKIYELNSSNIFEFLGTVLYPKIHNKGIQLILDKTSLVPSKITVTSEKILFQNGTATFQLETEKLEQISEMYTYTYPSDNDTLRLESISKHTFYLNNAPVGTLMLEDICFIIDLQTAFVQEFIQFIKPDTEYPDFADFYEAVSRYIDDKATKMYKKYLEIYDNRGLQTVFINSMRKLDTLIEKNRTRKYDPIQKPPTGISEQL